MSRFAQSSSEAARSVHGGVKQAGDVSFVYREQSIDSGIIIPGEPGDSELIARITSTDPDLRMPPPGEHGEETQPLSKAEIDLVSRWIEEGAPWGEHWALQAPVDHPLPAMRNAQWISQPLDAFVLARLEAEQLQPSAEASPNQWLRRASLDLIGIPPTPKETQRFIQACQAAGSKREEVYESEVERLLNSERFGERWAAMWMDLARYADTKGYEKDPHREMWPYRDWLIRAFNQDMPFDQFTIKQIAGDLLETPTADDLVATAFHRNTQTNTEGGTDDEEFSCRECDRPYQYDLDRLAGDDLRMRSMPLASVRSDSTRESITTSWPSLTTRKTMILTMTSRHYVCQASQNRRQRPLRLINECGC